MRVYIDGDSIELDLFLSQNFMSQSSSLSVPADLELSKRLSSQGFCQLVRDVYTVCQCASKTVFTAHYFFYMDGIPTLL